MEKDVRWWEKCLNDGGNAGKMITIGGGWTGNSAFNHGRGSLHFFWTDLRKVVLCEAALLLSLAMCLCWKFEWKKEKPSHYKMQSRCAGQYRCNVRVGMQKWAGNGIWLCMWAPFHRKPLSRVWFIVMADLVTIKNVDEFEKKCMENYGSRINKFVASISQCHNFW